MTDKAFVEITNICNLNCSFCAGHKRRSSYMSPESFKLVLDKLAGKVKYLYLHLMGEPLTHPQLKEILEIADGYSFRVMLTTNGTLLDSCADTLFGCKSLFKISISVHAFEGNGEDEARLEGYLDKLTGFAVNSAEHGIITVFRLWNSGGSDKLNKKIIARLHEYSTSRGETPTPNRSGERLCDKTFIEWGEKFDWPDTDAIASLEADAQTEDRFCYALRD